MFDLSFDLREYQISEAVTELFQKQGQMQELLLRLLSDCASLQTQTLPQIGLQHRRSGGSRVKTPRVILLLQLCFRGFSEFSLRLLSEGQFQSIVWTRNSAESVLVTQLFKSLRAGDRSGV